MTPDMFHVTLVQTLNLTGQLSRKIGKTGLWLLVGLGMVFVASYAYAQAVDPFAGKNGAYGYGGTAIGETSFDYGQIQATLEAMNSAMTALTTTISRLARNLLISLFVIDLVLLAGRTVLSGEEMGPAVSRFIYRLLFAFICFTLIANASEVIAWLSDKALDIAQLSANGAGVNFTEPSIAGIMRDAARDAMALFGKVEWNPGTWLFLIAGLTQLVVSAVMGAVLVVSTIELYLVGILGLFALGFAGLEVAQGSASLYIKSMIGKAMKLLGLMLMWSLTTGLTNAIVVSAGVTAATALAIIAVLIFTGVLIMTLPNSIEALAGGIGSSAAAAIAGGITAWAAGRAAATTAGAGIGGAAGALKGGIQGAKGGLSGGVSSTIVGGVTGAAKQGAAKAAQYGAAGAKGGVGGLAGKIGGDVGRISGDALKQIKDAVSKDLNNDK